MRIENLQYLVPQMNNVVFENPNTWQVLTPLPHCVLPRACYHLYHFYPMRACAARGKVIGRGVDINIYRYSYMPKILKNHLNCVNLD